MIRKPLSTKKPSTGSQPALNTGCTQPLKVASMWCAITASTSTARSPSKWSRRGSESATVRPGIGRGDGDGDGVVDGGIDGGHIRRFGLVALGDDGDDGPGGEAVHGSHLEQRAGLHLEA